MNAIILSAVWGIVMMYFGVITKNRSTVKLAAYAGAVLLVIANVLEWMGMPFTFMDTKGMLAFNSYGLVFNTVAYVCTLLYFMLGAGDMEKVGDNLSDYFALIFFILCGVAIVSGYQSLLMLFIGIEIISIPLYILAGSDKRNLKSNEASLKYFLMGAFSTGLMLMGIAMIYGATGTFQVPELNIGGLAVTPMMLIGIILILVSMSFKASAAPFHFWTPDVYDGSPTVFTAFMATVVKAAVFIAFLKLFDGGFGRMHESWKLVVACITALTLVIGNITAVFQTSVKRMMAYSSIAQAGFMMLAIFSINYTTMQGLILYAAAYCLASIGMFSVLLRMKDFTFDGFNGLAKHQPTLALTATICLLSLTGIPLTAGFFSKYYMLLGAMKTASMFWLVIVGIICAAVSVSYYFRVIQSMYFRTAEEDPTDGQVNGRYRLLLVIVSGLIILLGFKPGLLLDMLVL